MAFNAKWRPNGEDLRMQFADHVGLSKCKWNDAGRLGTKRGGLRILRGCRSWWGVDPSCESGD